MIETVYESRLKHFSFNVWCNENRTICVYTHNFMVASVLPDHRGNWLKNMKSLHWALKACKLKLSILSSMVLIRLLRYWPWNKTNESLNQTQFNKLELRPIGNPKLWKRSLNPNWSSTTDSEPMMTKSLIFLQFKFIFQTQIYIPLKCLKP